MLTISCDQARSQPLTPRHPRNTPLLKRLAEPPRVIIADVDGARIAEANPTALVFDRQAGCVRRDRLWRSARSLRVRRLMEHVLTALPCTELDRAEAMKAMQTSDPWEFSLTLRQIHHTLKPYGIGAVLFYGGRIAIVEQEASAC
jgi:hypothetical protein